MMTGSRPLRGTPASPGRGTGPAFLLSSGRSGAGGPGAGAGPLSEGELQQEVDRFNSALEATAGELEAQIAAAAEDAAGILQAHRLMLSDPMLVDAVEGRIRKRRVRTEEALPPVIEELARTLLDLDDEYLRGRATDVQDLGRRLLRHLSAEADGGKVPVGVVAVAREVAPSEVLHLSQAGAAAIATQEGAVNSHAAILARSLRIPMVVGVAGLLETVTEGIGLGVDGDEGEVTVVSGRPVNRSAAGGAAVRLSRTYPEVRTADGRRIKLYANISRPEELDIAIDAGAEGVGVLRTEFLFLREPPSEEHQYEVYRAMVERLAGRPLIVRTLDAGGDKPLPYLKMAPEANPFLGVRGLRLSLANPDVFLTQLRAILRANAHGPVYAMYPMVTNASEIEEANALLRRGRDDLLRQGVDVGEERPAGAMVEVPAAALCADALAAEAAFLSVGTNDLAQYALAADRNNPAVAGIYDQAHPAVLRLLQATVAGARQHGRPVAVCGEIAADIEMLPVLIGLGVDELSVGPYALEPVRAAIVSMSCSAAT